MAIQTIKHVDCAEKTKRTMQLKLLKKEQRVADPPSTSLPGFTSPVVHKREVALYVIFGLLFVSLILICAAGLSPFLAGALVGAIALVVVSMKRPIFALFLVFAGAGLPSLLLTLPGHTVRPIEVALFLCLIAAIMRRLSLRLRLPHLLSLLFLAIAVISFIHVPEISTRLDAYAADKRLYGWVLLLTALFCGTLLAREVKNPSAFLVMILLSNIPLYLICLAQAAHVHLPAPLEVSGAQNPLLTQGRLWGPEDGAATLGLYLVNLFAVALACWLLGTRRRDRAIGGLMTLATILAIIGSGTRSSAIAIGVILLFTFLLTRHFNLLLITLFIACVGIASFANKIIPLFAHDTTSVSNRIFLWQEALHLIAANPWTGIGLQQFHVYYVQFIISPAAQLNARGISVHNQYLEWAMESGIAWLLVGVAFLVSILSSCWQAFRRAQPGWKALVLAAGMALLGNMIGGFVDVPLDKPEAGVFVFLLAGVALSYREYIGWSGEVSRPAIPVLPFLESLGGTIPRTERSVVHPIVRSSQASSSSPRQFARAQGVGGNVSDDSAPNTEKTGRTVFIQLLSWGIAIPIIFPTMALLTRYLGPLQYGEYNFVIPYLSIFALLSGIGMDALVIRQLSRQKRATWRETLSYALGTRLLMTLLGVIASAVAALLLPVSAEQRNLLLLGSVSLIFSFSVNGLRMIYSYGFRAEQRVTSLALVETTNRVVTAGLIVVVVLLHFSLWWAYILIFYSDIPFFILQVIIARQRYGIRMRFSLTMLREHLFGGLPLLGHNIMALISGQADIFFLMLLAGPLSVGIYSLAMRITDPLLSIVVAYVTGVYPLLCSRFEKGRKHFAPVYYEATRILALGIIPLALFVSVEARNIVIVLGGEHFTAAVIAVQLLMWAMAATFFNQLAVRACMAANKERLIPYVTGISVGVNIITNLALIPHWSIIGAGVAAIASECVGLCLFSAILWQQVHLLSIVWVMLRVFFGNLPVLAFLLWQQHMPFLSPFLDAPILLLLIVAGCMATRTLSWKDLRMVRQILLNKSARKQLQDIAEWQTAIMPAVDDITDYPTLVLPRIKL